MKIASTYYCYSKYRQSKDTFTRKKVIYIIINNFLQDSFSILFLYKLIDFVWREKKLNSHQKYHAGKQKFERPFQCQVYRNEFKNILGWKVLELAL